MPETNTVSAVNASRPCFTITCSIRCASAVNAKIEAMIKVSATVTGHNCP
ncbi:Uncharacterised protein [Vibrio cholerae]|nr:Uncharacterised protein [Vibrio cholerae]CSI53990.1 Uncharacterised protein [Vibrio cholerae]